MHNVAQLPVLLPLILRNTRVAELHHSDYASCRHLLPGLLLLPFLAGCGHRGHALHEIGTRTARTDIMHSLFTFKAEESLRVTDSQLPHTAPRFHSGPLLSSFIRLCLEAGSRWDQGPQLSRSTAVNHRSPSTDVKNVGS